MGSWGTSAGNGAKAVAEAFYAGKTRKRGNCETDGRTYRLFGKAIAKRIPEDEISDAVAAKLDGRSVGRPLEFSFAGYRTRTTQRHLDALGIRASIYGGVTRMNGKKVDSYGWYTLEEIEALPDDPPKPVRKPRFVNLTMELFPA